MTAERYGLSPFQPYRAALDALHGRTRGLVSLHVAEPASHVILRLDPSSRVVLRVSEATGVRLPLDPNHLADGSGEGTLADRALWLGPDEWLLVGRLELREMLLASLMEARGSDHVSVVDVSAARCALDLAGEGARELLATGCDLDLDPRRFPIGRCAQTALARTAVLLEATSDDAYRITCRPSFAGHVAGWLLDAAEEFVEP